MVDTVGLWLWNRDLIQVRDFQAFQDFKDRPWLVEIVIHW
jgi:hypothetical protein